MNAMSINVLQKFGVSMLIGRRDKEIIPMLMLLTLNARGLWRKESLYFMANWKVSWKISVQYSPTTSILNIGFLVSTHVFGYYKLDKRNHILDAVDVYMDPIVRITNGIWVDVPRRALEELAELDIDVDASVHAAGMNTWARRCPLIQLT